MKTVKTLIEEGTLNQTEASYIASTRNCHGEMDIEALISHFEGVVENYNDCVRILPLEEVEALISKLKEALIIRKKPEMVKAITSNNVVDVYTLFGDVYTFEHEVTFSPLREVFKVRKNGELTDAIKLEEVTLYLCRIANITGAVVTR